MIMIIVSAAAAFLLFLFLFLLLRCFLSISGEFNVRVGIKVFDSVGSHCTSASYLLLRLTVRIGFLLLVNF
jgi:hypothetical protein